MLLALTCVGKDITPLLPQEKIYGDSQSKAKKKEKKEVSEKDLNMGMDIATLLSWLKNEAFEPDDELIHMLDTLFSRWIGSVPENILAGRRQRAALLSLPPASSVKSRDSESRRLRKEKRAALRNDVLPPNAVSSTESNSSLPAPSLSNKQDKRKEKAARRNENRANQSEAFVYFAQLKEDVRVGEEDSIDTAASNGVDDFLGANLNEMDDFLEAMEEETLMKIGCKDGLQRSGPKKKKTKKKPSVHPIPPIPPVAPPVGEKKKTVSVNPLELQGKAKKKVSYRCPHCFSRFANWTACKKHFPSSSTGCVELAMKFCQVYI